MHAVHGPLDPLERASDAVARGNRKVFEEIGREFARFLEACAYDDPDGSRVAAFLDSLRDGDAPDGQQLLRQAFTRYHQALTEPDLTRRAQLMYLANLLIGWHEQTRLQPEIQEKLEAPAIELRALGERLLRVFRASPARWHPARFVPRRRSRWARSGGRLRSQRAR